MPSPQLSLDQVAKAFSLWRTSKQNRFERIPSSLKDQALQLREHYSEGILIKHLQLSSGFFKSAHRPINKGHQRTECQPDALTFVPISVADSSPLSLSPCHIIKADGSQLFLQTDNPLSIVQAFLCSP